MSAALGNSYYLQRSKHGRDRIFASAEILQEAALEYIEFAEAHPMDVGDKKTKPRPLTLMGFCVFAGASTTTWYNSKERAREEEDNDFLEVLRAIQEWFDAQKIEGAAVGVYKENLIARLTGLVDKRETEHSGSLDLTNMTEKQLDDRIHQIMNKSKGD